MCWQSKRFHWERAPGWRAGGSGNPGEQFCCMACSLGFYGDGISFRVVFSRSFWLRVLPGGARLVQPRWMPARRILGGGRTCGVSFWHFLNSSGWWRLISSVFLTRTSCHKTSHANGHCGAWPGWKVSVRLRPLTVLSDHLSHWPSQLTFSQDCTKDQGHCQTGTFQGSSLLGRLLTLLCCRDRSKTEPSHAVEDKCWDGMRTVEGWGGRTHWSGRRWVITGVKEGVCSCLTWVPGKGQGCPPTGVQSCRLLLSAPMSSCGPSSFCSSHPQPFWCYWRHTLPVLEYATPLVNHQIFLSWLCKAAKISRWQVITLHVVKRRYWHVGEGILLQVFSIAFVSLRDGRDNGCPRSLPRGSWYISLLDVQSYYFPKIFYFLIDEAVVLWT